MEEQLSQEQVAELKEAFSKFDKDGDGSINTQELGAVMQALGKNLSEAELKEIISKVDTDADGVISFPEFLEEMVRRMKAWRKKQGLQEAFRVFDVDGNGYISVDELKQVMAKLGEELSQEVLEAMIHEADVDQDGQVNYEEFVRILSQK
ncbi:calmodulin-like [Manis pentadactyla]|uniref:calmodulin-like n=1 Tax=Manis pentadactyla TaxID=143292 RepID=UPI00255C78CE|nr:calmodulin-like [Manis pentadactyla]XP_057354157.1 calmodulin-like [Manis pentadactyla]